MLRNEKEVSTNNLFEQAADMHASLVEYGVCARDVPKMIAQTQEVYRQAILFDQQNFDPEIMDEPYDNHGDMRAMRVILNKFICYDLDKEDVRQLNDLHFPEADRLRAYLQFEEQAIAFAKFIRDYMLKLKLEISVKIQVNDEGKKTAESPAFYKFGEAPNGVKRLLHILRGVDRELVPMNIFSMYSKVFDVFENIKPSRTRPAATANFYAQHLGELDTFSFVPPVLREVDEREERVSSLSAIM